MPTDLPTRRPDPTPASGEGDGTESPPPALQGLFAVITLAALVTLVLLPLLRDDVGRGRPLVVALTEPRIGPAGSVAEEHLERIAMAARDALERHLSGRQGMVWTRPEGAAVAAVDAGLPSPDADDDDDDDGGVPPLPLRLTTDQDAAEAARAAGADEALVLEIGCDSLCRSSLRRIRAVDGSVTWQRPRVSLELDDLLAVEAEVGGQVEMAYLELPRRDGAPRLYARAEDYARYVDLRRRIDSAAFGSAGRLADELATLRRTSPRFYSAYLWEAEALRRDLAPGAEPGERLLDLLRQAHRIAPADRRPLLRLVPLLRRAGRPDEARDALAQLRSLYPNDPALERLAEPEATAGE